MKNVIIFSIAIILAGTGGYTLQKYLQDENTSNNPAIGLQRVDFSAPDHLGEVRDISEWDGKIVLLNFWATWCPPCMDEIPHFIELQRQYGDQGLQFIGVAIDEQELVQEFVRSIGMNYPTFVTGNDGIELAKRYGNGVGILPYTVLIERDGEIGDVIQGMLSKQHAIKLLAARGIEP